MNDDDAAYLEGPSLISNLSVSAPLVSDFLTPQPPTPVAPNIAIPFRTVLPNAGPIIQNLFPQDFVRRFTKNDFLFLPDLWIGLRHKLPTIIMFHLPNDHTCIKV